MWLYGLINIFPKSTVCVKTFLIFFKKLQSKLHKVLSKWFLLLKNCRKCSRKDFVESTSIPQLHCGFMVSWKPCLNSVLF